jgi:plasmid maintenance system antidote protein VapI
MSEANSMWSYIADELEARGWTEEDLAREMGGELHYNLCAFAFLKNATCVHLHMGDFANRLGKAFGTSAEVWVNIDEQFHRDLLASNPLDDAQPPC